METEQTSEVHKCTICGNIFDTKQALGGHTHHCKKKHEKKNNVNNEATAETTQSDSSSQEDPPEDTRKPRKERVPFGVHQVRFSDRPSDDGHYYRVFNDNWQKDPGRIQRALAAGYEPVDHPQSGMSVGTNDDGSEIKGVLMRLPQEFKDADDALKEKERAVIDDS
jgi:hypothetical protein